MFGPANLVTGVRALLVAFLARDVVASSPDSATTTVFVALIATVLDGVDGWVARRTGTASASGARFDMEVDALLILVLAILVWQSGKAGPWVIVSGLLRYVFVAAGWLLPWMRRPLTPTLRARTICIVQIAGLLLALLPAIAPPASAWIAAVSLAALSYSFLIDTVWLWKRRSG